MTWLDTDIINRALRLIKEKSISSLDENTPIARCCKDLYPQIRIQVLSSHPWNCAMKRIKLTKLEEEPCFGFTHYHQLPNDCLKIVELKEDQSWLREGHKIASNTNEAHILYIANIDSHLMNANLVRVIAARLAFEIAQSLGESNSLSERLWKLYQQEFKEAKHLDSCETGQGFFDYQSSWAE